MKFSSDSDIPANFSKNQLRNKTNLFQELITRAYRIERSNKNVDENIEKPKIGFLNVAIRTDNN